MEYKTHLQIVILSDNKFQEADYVAGIYKGIKIIDEDAHAVIGSPFYDRYISGIESAGYLIESYIRNKESLSKEDINRYLSQLNGMKTKSKLPNKEQEDERSVATKLNKGQEAG